MELIRWSLIHTAMASLAPFLPANFKLSHQPVGKQPLVYCALRPTRNSPWCYALCGVVLRVSFARAVFFWVEGLRCFSGNLLLYPDPIALYSPVSRASLLHHSACCCCSRWPRWSTEVIEAKAAFKADLCQENSRRVSGNRWPFCIARPHASKYEECRPTPLLCYEGWTLCPCWSRTFAKARSGRYLGELLSWPWCGARGDGVTWDGETVGRGCVRCIRCQLVSLGNTIWYIG